MRVYHVHSSYGKNDEKYYYVMPHDLKGTLKIYFGFDIKSFKWKISFYPWYSRFTGFHKWVKLTRLTMDKAQDIANKLNNI